MIVNQGGVRLEYFTYTDFSGRDAGVGCQKRKILFPVTTKERIEELTAWGTFLVVVKLCL